MHVRYRRQVLAVEVTQEVLRISSRSFTVAPITIAYRGHFRDVAPGDTCEFRLFTPRERQRDENRPLMSRASGGRAIARRVEEGDVGGQVRAEALMRLPLCTEALQRRGEAQRFRQC